MLKSVAVLNFLRSILMQTTVTEALPACLQARS